MIESDDPRSASASTSGGAGSFPTNTQPTRTPNATMSVTTSPAQNIKNSTNTSLFKKRPQCQDRWNPQAYKESVFFCVFWAACPFRTEKPEPDAQQEAQSRSNQDGTRQNTFHNFLKIVVKDRDYIQLFSDVKRFSTPFLSSSQCFVISGLMACRSQLRLDPFATELVSS